MFECVHRHAIFSRCTGISHRRASRRLRLPVVAQRLSCLNPIRFIRRAFGVPIAYWSSWLVLRDEEALALEQHKPMNWAWMY